MHLKKLISDPNRKTRLKMLAKQFGISEMQVSRIKSGENWGHIKI
jgi:DNA-binding Xre family transcriptional regulator